MGQGLGDISGSCMMKHQHIPEPLSSTEESEDYIPNGPPESLNYCAGTFKPPGATYMACNVYHELKDGRGAHQLGRVDRGALGDNDRYALAYYEIPKWTETVDQDGNSMLMSKRTKWIYFY